MDFSKYVDLIIKSLHALQSIKLLTIIKAAILAALIPIFITVWINKEPIYHRLVSADNVKISRLPLVLSERTKKSVDNFTGKDENIMATLVVTALFQTNERKVVYFNSDDYMLKKKLEHFFENKTSPTPLFLDAILPNSLNNNMRIVSIINGEFICTGIDALPVTLIQDEGLQGKIETICSLSIPPYFGYFTGYLTFYLKRKPSEVEMHQLKSAARLLSSEIYDTEILKN